MQAPKVLQDATAPNLEKKMKELVEEGDVLDITDPSLPNIAVNIRIKWDSEWVIVIKNGVWSELPRFP